jgi:putative transposase
MRVDQGTEFVSHDVDLWSYQSGVTLDFSRPGKPTDNAFIESFNGKFRADCLSGAKMRGLAWTARADRNRLEEPSSLVQGW